MQAGAALKSPFHLALHAVLLVLLPAQAMAYSSTLACVNGMPVGSMYEVQVACLQPVNLTNIFTSLSCQYQSIMDGILSGVFCSVQNVIQIPLATAIVLYVAIYGLQMVIGQIQVTWGEFLTRVLKLGLVWTFATNAAYGIGITYNFFLNGVELGVGWALKAILPMLGQIPNTGGETIAFAYLDQILYLIVATQFTTAGGALIGFMAAMSYIYPPIFAMFVTFFLFAMEMMMRTVMIYLVGIGAIGFLIALAPIFLGFALFRVTYSFFDDWLRYLISFTLQIVLGFICLAMWLSVIGYFTYFFGALMDIIKPVPPQVLAAAGAKLNVNPWGVCPFLPGPWTLTGPIPVCDPLGGDPILPSALGSNDDFISFMTLNLTSLCAIMYAFCHLMRGVPDIARNLAGPSYFASLGGAQMPSLFRDAVGEVTGAAQDATASTDLRTRFERDRARNQPLPPRERPPHAGG